MLHFNLELGEFIGIGAANFAVSLCCSGYQWIAGIVSILVVLVTMIVFTILCIQARNQLQNSGDLTYPTLPYIGSRVQEGPSATGVELTPPGTPRYENDGE